MTNLSDKGTALVTGASSGLGAIYADRLAKAGYDLILVARNGDRLRETADQVVTATNRTVDIIAADLTKPADLAKVEDTLRRDPRISMLVNNAGFGDGAPLLDSDIDKMTQMIELNVTALTRLTHAAAPGFVERGKGTLVNISSTVALVPELFNGVYGASKAYVLTFTRSLHHELANKGVRVQVVVPGAAATNFWTGTGVSVSNFPESFVMSAEDVVDAALAGLELGEVITIPSLRNMAEWDAYETAAKTMGPNLSRSTPAERYQIHNNAA